MASAALGAGAAHAQASDTWQFEATPYLWAAGMQGDVGIGRLTAEGIESSFSDIAKSLRVGFMGAFEGRKDCFGFLIDVMYMQLSQTKPAPLPLFGDVHAKPTQQAYSLAGTWRALPGVAPVDLVGGVRINDLKLDLDLSASALAPQGRTLVRSRSWVDGFVGVRAHYPVAPQWTLVGYVDVGGGGSDFTWQALAGVHYAISPTMTAKFGYRYLKVDYHRDDFRYDIATGGIFAGAGMRF
jgi:opacity protein-like surface antigen